MSAPSIAIENPFAEIQDSVSRFRVYYSTSERRLVWVKGTMSDVPALSENPAENEHVIDKWRFDTAVFVLMSPRTIKIELREEALVSSDPFPLIADLSLTCDPKDSVEALKCIAVSYQQCVLNLTKLAGSHLRARCNELPGELVAQHRTELEDSFSEVLARESDSLNPFRVTKVHLNLHCPAVGQFQQDKRVAELETPVACAKHANAIQKLAADLEIQQKKFERAQVEARQSVETEAHVTRARIESLQAMAQLCIEAKIALMQDHPLLAERIAKLEETRVGKDMTAFVSAMTMTQDVVRAMAEASRGFPGSAGPNIINTKM